MKYFLPAIICAIIIMLLSASTSVSNLAESWMDLFSVDKVGHLVVYGILTILLLRGFYQKGNYQGLSPFIMIIALLISSIYGISMEIMQYSFFPNRFFEVMDIIANIIGSLIGLIIFKHFFYS